MENDLIINEINKLKKEKNAVILVHNYQPPEIQDIADFLGDSLDLSRKAAQTDADIIVFCGVYFMAETAKILSPRKKVLLPNLEAGCPLADMITVENVKDLRTKYPDSSIVCYINSSADVKALSDVCCTSANAVDIVNNMQNEKIVFIPDQNLGHFVSTKVNKQIVLWPGYCATHHKITKEEVLKVKNEHKHALLLVHPECNYQICELADIVCGTNAMIEYIKKSDKKEFIIGTEKGIIHRLKKEAPDKEFFLASPRFLCRNMKKIEMQMIRDVLRDEINDIQVSEDIRIKAFHVITKMLENSK